MQRERTLKFWDDHYSHQIASSDHHQNQDWILQITDGFLRLLAENLSINVLTGTGSGTKTFRIMEIGCGTSILSRELWKYLQKKKDVNRSIRNTSSIDIELWATDASQVCIRQMQERDSVFLDHAGGPFQYKVLDIVQSHPELAGKFDAILDKGCLDTILFRSRQRGPGQPYASLIRTVIDHIQSWLRGETGIYLVVTPRHKLKTLRDYLGFSLVERRVLDLDDGLSRGDLEGQDNSNKNHSKDRKNRLFLYVCHKNEEYSPFFNVDDKQCFVGENGQKAADDERCPSCRSTFLEFRRGESLGGRGEAFWNREWKGHCIHCKTRNEAEGTVKK